MWSKNYKKCVKCKRDNIPHKAHGLCKSCYEAGKGYKWQLSWNKRHRKEINEKIRIWRKLNPEKERSYHRGKAWLRKIGERDGYKCKKCGSTQNLTLQHKIPRCIGGQYSYDNLEILCRKCNREDWNNLVKNSLKIYFSKKD